MSNYRRSRVPGGTWFFALTLADRHSRLLVDEIALLRRAYGQTQRSRSFRTHAICILPDHLHAIWSLPEGDADFAGRCSLLKAPSPANSPQPPKVPAKRASERKASGSAATGSIRFGMHLTCSTTSTTSTTTRSSTGWWNRSPIGLIRASIGTWKRGYCQETGPVAMGSAAHSASRYRAQPQP